MSEEQSQLLSLGKSVTVIIDNDFHPRHPLHFLIEAESTSTTTTTTTTTTSTTSSTFADAVELRKKILREFRLEVFTLGDLMCFTTQHDTVLNSTKLLCTQLQLRLDCLHVYITCFR